MATSRLTAIPALDWKKHSKPAHHARRETQTGKQGRAEVEFEDGSAVRLAPNSLVEFPQLSLRDSGARVSSVKVRQGTVYVDFRGGKDDEFTLNFVRETAALKDAAHFRVQVNEANATLAVFKGAANVEGASGSIEVGKTNRSLSILPTMINTKPPN